MALILAFQRWKYSGRMMNGHTVATGRAMTERSRRRIAARPRSALHRRHPRRRAAADRVVADLLTARRVRLRVPTPTIVKEPRAGIPIPFVAGAHRHPHDRRP